jgi:hemolysin III
MLCTRRTFEPLIIGLPPGFCWDYDRVETVADGMVHACSLAFAVIGAVVLAAARPTAGMNALQIASLVYAAALIATFGTSAAYNLWPVSSIKWILRRLDHASIYLFIAVTCTPFLSYRAAGSAWIVFLCIIWSGALMGAALKLLLPGKLERASIALYLLLGWIGFFAIWYLSDIPRNAFNLAVAGATLYQSAIVFHLWRRLRFQNVAWHALVLAATGCQFAAILICLAGPQS